MQRDDCSDSHIFLTIPNGADELITSRLDENPAELRRIAQAVSSGLHWLGRYAGFTETGQGYIEAVIGSACPEEGLPSWLNEYAYYIHPGIAPETPSSSGLKKGRLSSLQRDAVYGCITARYDRAGIRAEVSGPSPLAEMLQSRMYPTDMNLGYVVSCRKATLKIWCSAGLRDRDHALRTLESVSNSFSFALDVRYALGFHLSSRPTWPPTAGRNRAKKKEASCRPAEQPIKLDLNSYSDIGLRYYWHGRKTSSIPSMEYLSYYQILEYHFARYVLSEAVRFVGDRLKDPQFDQASEADLTRFVEEIGRQMSPRKNELPSLRATLNACVDVGSLVGFIEADSELRSHLEKKDLMPGAPRISPGKPETLLECTANRIYAIRNQLVHAKSGNHDQGTFILVPGSDGMKNLADDIKLVRFIAQSVLIASSTDWSI